MSLRQKFELIIFDCDGVLIDSEIIASQAHARALNEDGFSITLADIMERFTGVSSAEMYAELENEFGRKLPAGHHDRVKAAVLRAYQHDLKSIPGIHDAIAKIKIRKCVASSSIPAKLESGLRATKLYDAFAPDIFSAVQVANGKPAPDLFLFAADQMKTAPERCLVVEDSVAGTKAGIAAGMITIGFTGGSHCQPGHADRLQALGAAATLSDIRDLPKLIDRLETTRL